MDKIRVSAKTMEEAITKATIQLQTTSDRISYTVLVQGSKGILGIGAKPWIIEAFAKEEAEIALEEKKETASSAEKKQVEPKKEEKAEEKPKTEKTSKVKKKRRRKFFPKIRKLPRRRRKLIRDSVVAVMIRFLLRERKRGKEEKIKLSPIQSLRKKQ